MENATAYTLVAGPACEFAAILDSNSNLSEASVLKWRRPNSLEEALSTECRSLQRISPYVTDTQRERTIHEGHGNSFCDNRFVLLEDTEHPDRLVVAPLRASYTLNIRVQRSEVDHDSVYTQLYGPDVDESFGRPSGEHKSVGVECKGHAVSFETSISSYCLPLDKSKNSPGGGNDALDPEDDPFFEPSVVEHEYRQRDNHSLSNG
jgi:hypothetical protein